MEALIAGDSTFAYDPERVKAASERVAAFKLCRDFGWTYDEYMHTPIGVINDFLLIDWIKRDIENRRQKR